jgi:hypothetical protein
MGAYWGSGGIVLRIFGLGTKWRWVVSFTPLPLYSQGQSPPHLPDGRPGESQSRSERGGEEKISQPLRNTNLRSSNPLPSSDYANYASSKQYVTSIF